MCHKPDSAKTQKRNGHRWEERGGKKKGKLLKGNKNEFRRCRTPGHGFKSVFTVIHLNTDPFLRPFAGSTERTPVRYARESINHRCQTRTRENRGAN